MRLPIILIVPLDSLIQEFGLTNQVLQYSIANIRLIYSKNKINEMLIFNLN